MWPAPWVCGLDRDAPFHHMSMKHVAESRKAIAPDKTIFNLLGPLTNPANAKKQLLGVYSKDLMLTMAETLINIGTEKRVFVLDANPAFAAAEATSPSFIPKTIF